MNGPSKGALRAAREACQYFAGPLPPDETIAEIAENIDREMHAAEILTALQLTIRNVRSLAYKLPANSDTKERQSLAQWANVVESAITEITS